MQLGSSPRSRVLGKRTGRPRSLTEDDIIDAAIADGLESATMASVAKRLGVSHSALYRYFPGRTELVKASMSRVVAQATWPTGNEPWREMLTALADRMWEVFERHPGMAHSVLSIPGSPPGGVEMLDRLARGLCAQGFSEHNAALALDFVSDLTLTTFSMMSGLDTPFDARTARDEYLASLSDGPLTTTLRDDAIWRGRGWLDEKIDVMLDGFAQRISSS